ncbi:MAG: 3-dehydroquinate synthase [Gemmataceae bacterium]
MAIDLRVNLGPRSYDLVFHHAALDQVGAFARARSRGTSSLVIADENVKLIAATVASSLEKEGFRAPLVTRPPGEAQKSLSVAARLYDTLIDLPADRRTLIVAVGGGVIGDLAGFVAATYARGLPLLMVPTTLLAMVDSSIGGKVAVNHPRGKNMIGVFHQPVGVWIDFAALDTLPDREFRSGLAEIVKYGVILDPALFAYLEENAAAILRRDPVAIAHIVTRCCQLKAQVVEQDEREETGVRAILNYGHTFAHAFETAASYGAWLHGEAVAAGMVCASRLAERQGLVPSAVTQRQIALLSAFSLPTGIPAWDAAGLIATMRTDKKSVAGKMRFILPTRIGEVTLVEDIAEDHVRAVLGESTVPV